MRLQSRVEIHRPIREVFELILAPEHLPLWASGVSEAQRTYPGPMGLGATFELLQDGQAHKECWEVIEHEPPRTFACRRLDWDSFAQCRYTLLNVDGCTGLGLEVYSGVGTSPEPSPLLRQSAQRQLDIDLGRLRELLESGIGEEVRDGTAADSARGCGAAGSGVQPLGARGDSARPAGTQGVTVVPGSGSRRRGSGGARPREPG